MMLILLVIPKFEVKISVVFSVETIECFISTRCMFLIITELNICCDVKSSELM